VPSQPPDLAVVVVNYNTRDLLAACLRSLDGARVRIEVFVVDNGSRDGSAEMVQRCFPQVRLLEPGANLGLAGGSNLALRQTIARHVLLLNSDAEVLPGALDAVVAFLDLHPFAGAVGGRLLYPDGSFQHSAYRFPGLAQIVLDFFPLHHRLAESRLNGRYPRRAYTRPFEIDFPLGAFMAVRGETLARVGPLDPTFFLYCEEVDWAYRIRRAGWRIYCEPRAVAIHHGGQSTRQVRHTSFVQLYRSRYLLYQRYHSPQFQRAARLLVRACCLLSVARDALLARAGCLDAATAQSRRSALLAVARL
jgi:GT2 family glycosyltransferase